MNSLFNLPLHGVSCKPFCSDISNNSPLNISLNFKKILLNNQLKPLWVLSDKGERYHSEISLFKDDKDSQCYYLKVNCQGKGVFKIADDNISIDWHSKGTDSAHYFQTIALALYLELKNVLCIHANALAFENQAIALVAPSRTGKTTLTAALSQQGFSLMTDDMIALHKTDQGYSIYPSWPVARMWPDALNEMQLQTSNDVEYKKVHENFAKRIVSIDANSNINFCSEPRELTVIYLLNRISNNEKSNKATCEIVSIPKVTAVMLLLQNSILGSCYRTINLEESRVKALSALVSNVSFKQINYISGKQYLNDVSGLIKKDIMNNNRVVSNG